MKTRPACRLARSLSALRDTPPAHAAGCPDCRAWFAAAAAVETRLRRDAAPARATLAAAVPDDLERRLLAAVAADRAGRDAAPVARSRPRLPGWLPVSALGAAALAAAVVVTLPRRSAETAAVRAEAAALLAAVDDFSDRLVDRTLPRTGTFIADNPLQQELAAVYTDARAALDFLAFNFVPGKPPPSAAVHRTGG